MKNNLIWFMNELIWINMIWFISLFLDSHALVSVPISHRRESFLKGVLSTHFATQCDHTLHGKAFALQIYVNHDPFSTA